MKDPIDQATPDMLETPKRGRPKSGNALSAAEKQKAYRDRKKLEGLKTITLSRLEISAITLGLAKLVAEHQRYPTVAARYQEVLDRFRD